MDTSNALRIDANSRHWGGQHHGSEERKKQRASKTKSINAQSLSAAKAPTSQTTSVHHSKYELPGFNRVDLRA